MRVLNIGDLLLSNASWFLSDRWDKDTAKQYFAQADGDVRAGGSGAALWVVQAPLLSIIGLDKYQEEASDGPPIVGTLYVQQWALRKLTGGDLPDRVRVTMTVDKRDA
ncbi:MAG: hypothetical protein DRJ03_27820 [Chloroflexi bacterium]|nr:MAG: hypothetical protein DRI81_12405 [Chloroflexota bacterium]RLC76867.1 MAG: hypothetical protein DRJ03_27820 [Chloroflexota bacterium]